MVRARSRTLLGLPCLRRLAWGMCATGGVLALGCTRPLWRLDEYGPVTQPSSLTVASANPPAALLQPILLTPVEPQEVVQVGHQEAAPVKDGTPRQVPINLDTVLHLAEEQNAQIALAREKLNQSQLESQVECSSWLPNTYAGIAYYRHEGGIQNEDGTLTHSSTGALFPGLQIQSEIDVRQATYQRVNAERKVWQQKGELSRVSNETLLDAANTYIDLLTARRAEAVVRELEKLERKVLRRAEALYDEGKEPAARVMVEGTQTALSGRRQALAKLRQQGDAASAKLAYLLGLGPDCCLVPVDLALTPIDLVDVTPPTCDLVDRALANGPGIKELQGLLAVIQGGIEQASSSPSRFLPILEFNIFEGAFGAGPGANLAWDNRFDFGFQARWNLRELATARERKKIAQSGLTQVEISLEDLRGKLTAGVREAREAIVSGREQIRLGTEEIQHASETYRLSNLRLEENVQGSSPTEVLQAIRGLEGAHLSYVQAISAYNKAQVRLLLLLGPANTARPPEHPVPPGAHPLPPPALPAPPAPAAPAAPHALSH